MRYGCERHAVTSVVPEASSRQSLVCHRIRKSDLDICRGLHGLGEYGCASAPARSWDRGARCFVRRFVLGLDGAEACFGGSMTGEACRSMVPAKCYAVHSSVCVLFPFILDIKFVGRTSRGHTGGRSHRIFHPPSFCGACRNFSREKDSAIPFPRRP